MIRRRPPDPLPRFYRWRTNVLQAPLFFLYTGLCGSCSLFASLWDKSGRLQHRIAQIWARGCVRISGARLTSQRGKLRVLPSLVDHELHHMHGR